MKILGAVICELLGDPKWTERLRTAANKYKSEINAKESINNLQNSDKARFARRLADRNEYKSKGEVYPLMNKGIHNDYKYAKRGKN